MISLQDYQFWGWYFQSCFKWEVIFACSCISKLAGFANLLYPDPQTGKIKEGEKLRAIYLILALILRGLVNKKDWYFQSLFQMELNDLDLSGEVFIGKKMCTIMYLTCQPKCYVAALQSLLDLQIAIPRSSNWQK